MNTNLLIFKGILLLTASPNLSLHQNCKIRFLLEGTNTLFIPEGMLFKLFYEAQGGRQFHNLLGYFLGYHLQGKVFHGPASFKGSVHGHRDL